jgi:SecD/SecF fusion protein
MKRILLVLTIPLAVIVAAGLLIAIVWAFVRARDVFVSPPQGAVLIYEVDPESIAGPPSDDLLKRLANAIDRRLNSDGQRRGRVRLRDDRRLEIRLYESRPEAVREAQVVIEALGVIEFRVLANTHDHDELIQRAKADPAASIHGGQGDLLAWWVPVRDTEIIGLETDKDIATRRVTIGDRERMEVLVVKDDFDVTGRFLTSAEAARDRNNMPCVDFAFNSEGGQRFGALTSANTPDPLTGLKRRLGIILDGTLQSAPSLRSTIYNRGEITGNFTDNDVRNIANVLNAGSLPAPVRRVEEPETDDARQE